MHLARRLEQCITRSACLPAAAAVAAGNAAAAAANAAAASTLAPVVVQVQPSLSTVTVTGEMATNGVLTPAQIYEKVGGWARPWALPFRALCWSGLQQDSPCA